MQEFYKIFMQNIGRTYLNSLSQFLLITTLPEQSNTSYLSSLYKQLEIKTTYRRHSDDTLLMMYMYDLN